MLWSGGGVLGLGFYRAGGAVLLLGMTMGGGTWFLFDCEN